MKKDIFGFALCVLLFALSFAAEAQQPKKVPRTGDVSVEWRFQEPRAFSRRIPARTAISRLC